ncbi:nucleotidyltransferase domain-containing protein [Patescibacteria group bacterium]|nr:nucleotidyltransferase domain-containing protein [Patescibacteria group bacterium]
MTAYKLRQIRNIFKSYPKIKLAYFFGSRANGKAGPLSDYDFAVFIDGKDKKIFFDIRFSLMDKISRLLKTDNVDIVVLNLAESPELKYNIIKEGKLIYEKELFRVIVEPKILNEYFDFNFMLKKYNLTKV